MCVEIGTQVYPQILHPYRQKCADELRIEIETVVATVEDMFRVFVGVVSDSYADLIVVNDLWA